MYTTDKTGVAFFIDQCQQFGMKHVVCSPGSRNASVVIALEAHPEIETIVIHDERSAAFYALGMAQELDAPVGVVCTSGSAMLNYYPAVAEAYYQCVPLIVMSADRPQEWVNHGDGQTIVQKGVYKNHIRFEGEVGEYLNDARKATEMIREGFEAACTGWKGPVHFNIPLSEPLYNREEFTDFSEVNELPYLGDERLDLSLFREKWAKAEKKMILCGQLPKGKSNHRLTELLAEVANDSSVVVLVENTSNLVHPSFVHCIDRTLSVVGTEIEDFKPDLLISIGGAVISKRIKKFLRESYLKEHWKIGYDFPDMDTYRAKTATLETTPLNFFKTFLKEEYLRNVSSFGARWRQRDYQAKDEVSNFMESAVYSDLSVFALLLDYLPESSVLHMGNSSVVRYCQLFDPLKSVQYQSNRGTSGIDGSTSTACGAALVGSRKLHVMITGDVSFFYDSNALWSNHLTSNLRIILINNSGGGIFRIIDGPSSTGHVEKYFEAQHAFSAEHLCKAFNVEYSTANSIETLEKEMFEFYQESKGGRPKLLEVMTPNLDNDTVLKDFFKHIQSL